MIKSTASHIIRKRWFRCSMWLVYISAAKLEQSQGLLFPNQKGGSRQIWIKLKIQHFQSNIQRIIDSTNPLKLRNIVHASHVRTKVRNQKRNVLLWSVVYLVWLCGSSKRILETGFCFCLKGNSLFNWYDFLITTGLQKINVRMPFPSKFYRWNDCMSLWVAE